MRFLADESCDFAIVCALREAGHDVLAVTEISPGAEDTDVIKLAIREKRILITEDKDFGQLVFAQSQPTGGVIFLRYPFSARQELAGETVNLVKQQGNKLTGCFVVIQLGRIRITRKA
jgi:predicted nuclease of predicted toxin-antitoxin system